MKTVKSISHNSYEIVLVETERKGYRIVYSSGFGIDHTSENILDLNTALCLFEIKLQELQGH